MEKRGHIVKYCEDLTAAEAEKQKGKKGQGQQSLHYTDPRWPNQGSRKTTGTVENNELMVELIIERRSIIVWLIHVQIRRGIQSCCERSYEE